MGKPERIAEVLARVAGEAPESKYIRAYHGSPYDFDRFDASKIGTGEGMASYGYGHNFASRQPVAEYYRDSLKDMLDREPPADLFAEEQAAMREWAESSNKMREWENPPSGHGNLLAELGHANPHRTAADDALARAMRAREEMEAYKNRGRVYEVEIAHPASSLLDWDRSLSDQQHLLPQIERAINAIPDPAARYDNMLAIEDPGSFKGKEVYGVLRNSLGGDIAASRALLDSGVPGMRYLDGPSRSSDVLINSGSQNTLMFPGTEDQIRILRKYAVPGAIGAGAMQDQPQSRPSPSY
jgi:hypothetical protein